VAVVGKENFRVFMGNSSPNAKKEGAMLALNRISFWALLT
jgi:hypothetical protein